MAFVYIHYGKVGIVIRKVPDKQGHREHDKVGQVVNVEIILVLLYERIIWCRVGTEVYQVHQWLPSLDGRTIFGILQFPSIPDLLVCSYIVVSAKITTSRPIMPFIQ